jgi:hypothetical protein
LYGADGAPPTPDDLSRRIRRAAAQRKLANRTFGVEF